MDGKILVSIIINNYNYDRFLKEAINSTLNQTYPYTEVIVVDDGSTDTSREIIGEYGDRVFPIFQKNSKQGVAFNNGFAKSQGDIIIFLDSDDYLFPDAVEKIVAVWQPNLAKVHYRLSVVDSDGASLGYSCPQGSEPLAKGEVWRTLIEMGGYASTPTSGNALSRFAMEKVFPIPNEYKTTADDYLSYSIPFYGEIDSIEEPLGAYRIHNNNQWALTTITGDRFHRFIKHDLQAYSLLIEKAKELGYEVPKDFEFRPVGRFRTRLASLRLNPEQHPIPSEHPWQLVYWGIRAIWKYSNYNWQKRLIHSLWFIWAGILPLPLAKLAITWSYAPHFRPQAINWTLTKVRSLVS
jgi:glycosyltransferase involved in cell wall biosynthesis